MVDLHTHSTFSDGTLTPSRLISYAKHKGLRALSLTDHDTIDGLAEAYVAAKEKGIEFINGIELAAAPKEIKDIEIHIVGLFIDKDCPKLKNSLLKITKERENRNANMLKRFKDIGITLHMPEKLNVVTRAHFARALVAQKHCKTVSEAFEKYLTKQCYPYIRREHISSKESISIIKEAKGIAILAHPLLYKLDNEQLESLIVKLIEYGLDGIECIYTTHSKSDELMLKKMALKYNLKVSGGSDFHSLESNPLVDLANKYIPYEIVEKLKET